MTHKLVDTEAGERAGGAAHGGKRPRAHKLPHDYGIGRIVKLLKKRAE